MSTDLDAAFGRLRPGRFVETLHDGLERHQAAMGNISPQGFLADGSVFSDTIRANAVVAEKIAAGAIETDHLAANAVTAAKIEAGTITSNEIASNTITANNIAANTITSNEIASNTITASEIAASAITASELAADSVTTTKILAGNVTSSRIELTISGKNFGANDGTTSQPGLFFDSASNYGLRRSGSMPRIVVAGSDSFQFGSIQSGSVEIVPLADNTYQLGSSSFRWSEVWATDGSINTSDARLKRDVHDTPLGLAFVRALHPVAYRWRETTDTQAREGVAVDDEALAAEAAPLEERIAAIRADQQAGKVADAEAEAEIAALRGQLAEVHERHLAPVREAVQRRRPGRRFHHGLIAQEVRQALDAVGVEDAAFLKIAPDGTYSLAYSEFVAPLVRAVQEAADEIDQLRARIEALERDRE